MTSRTIETYNKKIDISKYRKVSVTEKKALPITSGLAKLGVK